MKFLENSILETLSWGLQSNCRDCSLDLRIEAYSCKMVQSDKKQWKKEFDAFASQRQALSPPEESLCVSPMGRRLRHLSEPSQPDDELLLLDSISPRTLFDLIGVLNTSFPDYDFSDRKSGDFSLVPSFEAVVSHVDEKLVATVFEYPELRDTFWQTIQNEIHPEECSLYTLKCDYGDDPFSEDGCMWSFNFFFHNPHLKRLLFLSCRALPIQVENEQWEME